MNRFRYEALVEEFPFIPRTVMERKDGKEREVIDCESITIRRVTKQLLERTPEEYAVVGSLVGVDQWTKVDFVLDDRLIIRNAVKNSGSSHSNYAYEGDERWEGESVLEAIHRLKVADKLAYIVWTTGGYDVVEHFSLPTFKALIYKPSKEFTFQEEIDRALNAAREIVKAESNF